MYTCYISHHGIKGQKWGVRRYQNPDGSLTSFGRKRLEKLDLKISNINAERKKLDPNVEQLKTKNPHGKKSIFDMDDAELKSEIERLNLEKQYKQYMRELYPSKKKESLINGRKIVAEILNSSITNVGKKVGENLLGAGVNKIGKGLGLQQDLYTGSKNKNKSSN